MASYPKRLLNPEFVEAVRNAPMTRCTIAQLVGYGPYQSNLHRDLTRTDGTPQTPVIRERNRHTFGHIGGRFRFKLRGLVMRRAAVAVLRVLWVIVQWIIVIPIVIAIILAFFYGGDDVRKDPGYSFFSRF